MPDGLITSVSYISTARSDLEISDFQNILDSANLRNEELGLTGLLAFNGLNFMQILEGARNDVNSCIRLIEGDKRHEGMVIFDRRDVPRREFPDWKMAGVLLNQAEADFELGIDELLSSEWVNPETRKHFESFQSFGSPAE